MQKTMHLLARFYRQEVRNSNVLFSLGLYLLGVTYLIYLLTGNNTSDAVWNTLLWVVVFFGTVQLSSRSFEYESDQYFFYYQNIATAKQTIIAKLLFNSLYMMTLSGAAWLLFTVFFGNPVYSTGLFLIGLILGSIGFSVVLTLTSGIAQRTKGNATLSAILAIPLLFPVLQLTSALNLQAIVGVELADATNLIGALAALDMGIGLLAYLLFPYLWQD
jgi:heme exporter protein B